MRLVLILAGASVLAACGANEDAIRADERNRILEERVAQLEAEREEGRGDIVDDEEPIDAGDGPADKPVSSEVTQSAEAPATLIAAYNAYIGEYDIYNSNGKRLTAPWQVLRQDRANYHRFNIAQTGDESDPIFNSARNRGIMERMVANGSIDRSAGQRIVAGDVNVRVEIYGNGSRAQWVDVTVR